MKTKILSSSLEELKPFAHLEPIICALIEAGNKPTSVPWFLVDKDGWYCQLQYPIDFDYLETRFEFPPSINLLRESGGILDTLTWTEINTK